jgi:non-specific serine/threonine protein kinase
MRKVALAAGAVLLPLGLILVPLSAFVELPLEKDIKTTLGANYGKTCDDYETVGKGDSDAWREEGSLPTLRDEPRGVKIGDSLYLAGGAEGEDAPRAIATFQSYGFGTGDYDDLPELPQRLNHVGIAVHDGDVLIAGGFRDGFRQEPVAVDDVIRYDVDERRWEPVTKLPTARGALGMEVVSDRLYTIGGLDPGQKRSYGIVEIYDFETGRWSEGAPLPRARDHIANAVVDSRIYVLGGRGLDRRAVTNFDVYEPRSDRWQALPPLPYPASGTGLVEIDGRLITAGGEDPARGRLVGYSWAYDLESRTWERLPAMSKPKHGYAVAAHQGRFWAFGGSACYGFEPDADVSSLDPPRG